MHAHSNDRNKIYSTMKRLRNEPVKNMTNTLTTPVGTFYGEDVLEGFAADAEHLAKPNDEAGETWYDNTFYKLCKLDNIYIFEFLSTEPLVIPQMKLSDLETILSVRMKAGKSCDLYQVTVEHLRNCGTRAKQQVVNLINRIVQDIYYLSCPQIKIGMGTPLFKGKKKPVTMSNSYRRITVSPIIGAIFDYYVDPIAESTFSPKQSPDQLGFTAGVSYLLAAVARGECQRWALDHKLTCYGISLDGEAAFPSVERDVQIRELYSTGERGDLLAYSKNTYQNTECLMKLKGKLSRKISEKKGNRQGHVRASGHFKVYISPCLESLSNSKLGFNIGPFCITSVCVADDTYVLSDTPSGLQGALGIVSHYGKRYQLKFNAGKTKAVITGSKTDMLFYKDTCPWHLNGDQVAVVDDNEHLGLLVAGLDEEQKNVDENVGKCRKSLFSLLGPAYAYKCLLSPVVQAHLWNTYNLPVLLSGLAALPIRPSQIVTLSSFHKKILRGFLKLSKSSPIPALHFMLGELPVEAKLHIATLTLFHNIWSNPDITLHGLVKYIMMMSTESSLTWSNHIQILCRKYSLPCPLLMLQGGPAWSKEKWKCLVKTRVTTWYEKELRLHATTNSKMEFLNVQLTGLSGQPHPALHSIQTTQDSKRLRLHLKFLCGDLLTGG